MRHSHPVVDLPDLKQSGVNRHNYRGQGNRNRSDFRGEHDSSTVNDTGGQRNCHDFVPGSPNQILNHLSVRSASEHDQGGDIDWVQVDLSPRNIQSLLGVLPYYQPR